MNKDNNDVSVNEDNDKSVNEDNNKRVNEDNNKSVNEDNNESENENDNVIESESESEHHDDEQYYKIKQLNNYFKTIEETKPFEEQIEILKKKDILDEYWHIDYHDDKELNIKIFKAKVAYLVNDLDEQFFKKMFGNTFVALADKLINTRS